MTITPIVIHSVFPLRDYIGGTTHLHDQSNSQLKVTKYWDRLIVELLAFVSFSGLNFIALLQSDKPQGADTRWDPFESSNWLSQIQLSNGS